VTEEPVLLDQLIDTEVVEIKLYGGIELIFGEDRESVLRIESDFQIVQGGKNINVRFSPSRNEESFGLNHLAAIFRKTVIAALAGAAGDLTLDFSNSVRMNIEHNDNYEAWMLSSRSGGSLISLPGGGLG
jgi:hypothetical protein